MNFFSSFLSLDFSFSIRIIIYGLMCCMHDVYERYVCIVCLAFALFTFFLFRFWNKAPHGNSIFMLRFVIIPICMKLPLCCWCDWLCCSVDFLFSANKDELQKKIRDENDKEYQRHERIATKLGERHRGREPKKRERKLRDHYRNVIWTINFGTNNLLLLLPVLSNISLVFSCRFSLVALRSEAHLNMLTPNTDSALSIFG